MKEIENGTRTDELADGIIRFSTHAGSGLTFNQFLIDAEEPVLFHCGTRSLFPLVAEAVSRVMPIPRIRWISFGHVEADEMGAMNLWLEVAPHAQVFHSPLGCAVSIDDLADRPPRPLHPDRWLELGGRRIKLIETPHVPHNQEAIVLFEEVTATLLCGDLASNLVADTPVIDECITTLALQMDVAHPNSAALAPGTTEIIHQLAELHPTTLAVMHGASFQGDGAAVLRRLAESYAERTAGRGRHSRR